MKSATIGQFHELFSKLLIATDYKQFDFDQIQKIIKDPKLIGNQFIEFINNGAKTSSTNREFSTKRDGDEYSVTSLKKGDVLNFFTEDKTVAIYRESLGGRIYFKIGKNTFDDKRLTELKDANEILRACSLLGEFLGFNIKLQDDHKKIVRVKFI